MSAELAPLVTGEVVSTLTMQAARVLTDEVKSDHAALWGKLLYLYEGDAHAALGYSSWGDYYAAEFGESKSRGYQFLEAAKVVREIEARSKTLERPASDSVARELAPLLADQPNEIPVVWGEVVAEHGPTPTAKQVKQVVARHVAPTAGPEPDHKVVCPTCGHMVKPDDFKRGV